MSADNTAADLQLFDRRGVPESPIETITLVDAIAKIQITWFR